MRRETLRRVVDIPTLDAEHVRYSGCPCGKEGSRTRRKREMRVDQVVALASHQTARGPPCRRWKRKHRKERRGRRVTPAHDGHAVDLHSAAHFTGGKIAKGRRDHRHVMAFREFFRHDLVEYAASAAQRGILIVEGQNIEGAPALRRCDRRQGAAPLTFESRLDNRTPAGPIVIRGRRNDDLEMTSRDSSPRSDESKGRASAGARPGESGACPGPRRAAGRCVL